MDRGAWQATVHGVTRVRQVLAAKPLPRVVRKECAREPVVRSSSGKCVCVCVCEMGAGDAFCEAF